MNITFMIGNGFDINCGIRTRYTDMYPDYIDAKTDNPIIQKFKNDLKQDYMKGFETWNDFEMGMAEYSNNFTNEAEFIACIRDFKNFMTGFLIKEQSAFRKRIENNDALQIDLFHEVGRSLSTFYKNGVVNNTINTIEAIMPERNLINYNFISFNYTTEIANSLIQNSSSYVHIAKGNSCRNLGVMNIHGNLGRDVVLGVDNETQFKNLQFQMSSRGKRAFIKPFFNDEFDRQRVQRARAIINNSDVICVYGMSLGDSDLTWRNAIKNWLVSSQYNHLFYYSYSASSIPPCPFDELIDQEEDEKIKLLSRFEFENGLENPVSSQIHIPIGKNIFNIRETIFNYHMRQSKKTDSSKVLV